MGLINLKTNLKNLKFGNDSIGGSSNQPYIQTPIPDGRIESNPDFILKGGVFKKSKEDFDRITKFFADTKSQNGFRFIAKQELLSRISPKTQASGQIFNEGLYNPLSTLTQVAGVGFGLHLPKQTRQSTYTEIVKASQSPKENRLIQLFKGELGDNVNIMSYGGGPGSILGIGKTNIKFSDQRTGGNNKNGKLILSGTYQVGLSNSSTDKSDITPFNIFKSKGVSSIYSDLFPDIKNIYGFNYAGKQMWNESVYEKNNFPKINPDKLTQNNTKTLTQEQLNNYSDVNVSRNVKGFEPKIIDFRKSLREQTTYQEENLENRVNLGNPSKKQYDLINALEVLKSKDEILNDSIQFRIQSITYDGKPDYIMQFRAFLNNISDSYNAEWQSKRYIGRAENFYNYTGFNRTISLSWVIAAQSRKELIPMYNKLNYLASNLAPSYSGNGYMRGPLVKLTVGGYLYEVSGFINSLTFDIQEDATWDIGIGEDGKKNSAINELPHIIRVNGFNFSICNTRHRPNSKF